jgi:hypothetical protein
MRNIDVERYFSSLEEKAAGLRAMRAETGEGWRPFAVYYFQNGIGDRMQDRAFSDVGYPKDYETRGILGECVVNLEPCTFVNFEVVMQIPPLKEGDDGVSYREWNRDAFEKRFPPIHGLVPGLFGLIGIGWGWWNVRNSRNLPISGIIFFVGCALWSYGCIVMLPWSVS